MPFSKTKNIFVFFFDENLILIDYKKFLAMQQNARKLARLMNGLEIGIRNWNGNNAQIRMNHLKIDSIQESLLYKERMILVNAKDEEIGPATKFEAHQWSQIQKNQCLHRAFSVFLFNSKQEMLLQQRATAKVTFPGKKKNL